MGSAALAHLARRGKRAIGFERFSPAHAMGSSHGGSRIIRQAYFLDPAYVPLVQRADELWRDLERDGEPLLRRSGGLMLGAQDSQVVAGSTRSAVEHDLPHELLDAPQLRKRFPAMRFRDGEVALYEPSAGYLFPEACILAHLRRAVEAGAEARFGTAVTRWESDGDRVTLKLAGAEWIEAGALVIAAGAWFAQVAPALGLPLQIERNVMHWFAARGNQAELEALPVYIVMRDEGRIYGFPYVPGQGTKLAFYHSFDYTTADSVDRRVAGAGTEPVRDYLAGLIPDAAGPHLRSAACLYTLTPDEHFVIGLHPRYSNVAVAGGFSGHGYKFCSVVGEIMSDLIVDGATRHPIATFDPQRFAPSSQHV